MTSLRLFVERVRRSLGSLTGDRAEERSGDTEVAKTTLRDTVGSVEVEPRDEASSTPNAVEGGDAGND